MVIDTSVLDAYRDFTKRNPFSKPLWFRYGEEHRLRFGKLSSHSTTADILKKM